MQSIATEFVTWYGKGGYSLVSFSYITFGANASIE